VQEIKRHKTRLAAQYIGWRGPAADPGERRGGRNGVLPGVIIGGVSRRHHPSEGQRRGVIIMRNGLLHPAGRWCVGGVEPRYCGRAC